MSFGREAFVRLASLAPMLAEAQAEGLGWLSGDERSRVDAMGARSRREQFIAAHWLARCHAAEVFGGRPQQWCLSATDDGAPLLTSAAVAGGAQMFVSLSHSGAWLATAIAAFPVGVDVQCERSDRNVAALLEYCFSTQDCASVRQLPEDEQRAAFYRLWTLAEAHGKRDGHGLRPELSRGQQVLAAEPDAAEAVSWSLGCAWLAVAGAPAMRVQPSGFAEPIAPSFWRFAAAGA